jgi:Sigma-70 factor, region 1.1
VPSPARWRALSAGRGACCALRSASRRMAAQRPSIFACLTRSVRNLNRVETLPDSSLLDLSDAAVKKLIRSAKKRGHVTHDQINSVLPSEEVNSEQIEDVLAMFREMGALRASFRAGSGHGSSTSSHG